jgi:GrpB-like predicted nucleotidyltransferase (UPF0157 family)
VIELAPYDPRWPIEFGRFRAAVLNVLGGLDVFVDHEGSTAVPGLISKPILDIDVVIRDPADFPDIRSRLEGVGYIHRGDQGIPGREVFRTEEPDGARKLGGGRWSRHHLYVCGKESREYRRHVAFRDALRSDAALANRYAELKRALVRVFGGDRERYSEGKTEFIEAVLSELTG